MPDRIAPSPPVPSTIVLVRMVLEASADWVAAKRIEAALGAAGSPGRVNAALWALRTTGVVRERRAADGGLEWRLVRGKHAGAAEQA